MQKASLTTCTSVIFKHVEQEKEQRSEIKTALTPTGELLWCALDVCNLIGMPENQRSAFLRGNKQSNHLRIFPSLLLFV